MKLCFWCSTSRSKENYLKSDSKQSQSFQPAVVINARALIYWGNTDWILSFGFHSTFSDPFTNHLQSWSPPFTLHPWVAIGLLLDSHFQQNFQNQLSEPSLPCVSLPCRLLWDGSHHRGLHFDISSEHTGVFLGLSLLLEKVYLLDVPGTLNFHGSCHSPITHHKAVGWSQSAAMSPSAAHELAPPVLTEAFFFFSPALPFLPFLCS